MENNEMLVINCSDHRNLPPHTHEVPIKDIFRIEVTHPFGNSIEDHRIYYKHRKGYVDVCAYTQDNLTEILSKWKRYLGTYNKEDFIIPFPTLSFGKKEEDRFYKISNTFGYKLLLTKEALKLYFFDGKELTKADDFTDMIIPLENDFVKEDIEIIKSICAKNNYPLVKGSTLDKADRIKVLLSN